MYLNNSKTFMSGPEALHVLDGIDLTIQKGEMLAIVGASGVGKAPCFISWEAGFADIRKGQLWRCGCLQLDRQPAGAVPENGYGSCFNFIACFPSFRRSKISFAGTIGK